MERFLLRQRDVERRTWVRRTPFGLGWRHTLLMDAATNFGSREAAVRFVHEYHLGGDFELVVVSTEEVS